MGVGQHQRYPRHGFRHACGGLRQPQYARRLAEQRHAFMRHNLAGRPGQAGGTKQGCRQPRRLRLADGLRRRPGGVRAVVAQREQHVHQRDAVGDGMVQPAEEHALLAVALDQVKLPQRAGQIQRRAGQVVGRGLERRQVAGGWQGDAVQVRVQLEVRVRLPEILAQRQPGADDALLEALEAQQPVFDSRPQAVVVHRLVELEEARDHHRVGAALHLQPTRIGVGHWLAGH